MLPCVAGGIVGARNVLTAEPLKNKRGSREENGEEDFEILPARKPRVLNSPHTSVREKRIGREKYARQSMLNDPSYISLGALCFALLCL